jgi:DNA-binding IscR family transcriptional regulator
MAVIEGPTEAAPGSTADSPVARALAETWREITAAQQEMLNSVTLADLLDKARRQTQSMYYI